MTYRLISLDPPVLVTTPREDGYPLTRSIGNPEEWSAPEGHAWWPEEEQDIPEHDETTQRLRRLPDALGDGVVEVRRYEVEDIDPAILAARQVAASADVLQAAFAGLSDAMRARFLPVRAGVKLALDEGDVTAGRLLVEGIEPADAAEEQIKAAFLAQFPEV